MLLSKLVYQCIKDVVYYDDYAFNYEQFLQGRFEGDPDYATSINNVFSPLNAAITRLNDLERIPYRVVEIAPKNNVIKISDLESVKDINDLTHAVKEIVGVSFILDGRIVALDFRTDGGSLFLSPYPSSAKIIVEYKEEIPPFDEDSYNYDYINDENDIPEVVEDTVRDVELRNYGIKDSYIPYIQEYVKGFLSEPISAELANMHLTRAEQYFNNINPVKSSTIQTNVKIVYSINGD